LLGLLLPGAVRLPAAETGVDDLLNRAQAADLNGEFTNALALVNQAIETAPTNAQCFYVRGRIYAHRGDPTQAVADFDRVLQVEPRAGQVYEYRGFERFKLGQFDGAVGDFDQYLRVLPKRAPFLWQRGVACYYAGRYAEGRRQFESHRLVNSNDVQNAAWHFACVARQEGTAGARAALFPRPDDRRVPMMQLYALLEGRLRSDDVLLAAKAGKPAPAELKMRLFLAHFYIGLYYEATGEATLAREYIATAADDYAPPIYLGDVARMHVRLLRKPAAR
jgi:lipoprotein NlpI